MGVYMPLVKDLYMIIFEEQNTRKIISRISTGGMTYDIDKHNFFG